jgi:hypothetical protein
VRPSPDRKRLLPEPNCATRGKTQFVGDDIPTIEKTSPTEALTDLIQTYGFHGAHTLSCSLAGASS